MHCFLQLIVSGKNKKPYNIFILVILLITTFLSFNLEVNQNKNYFKQNKNYFKQKNTNDSKILNREYETDSNVKKVYAFKNAQLHYKLQGTLKLKDKSDYRNLILNKVDLNTDDHYVKHHINIDIRYKPLNIKTHMNYFRFIFCFFIIFMIIKRIIFFIQKKDGKKDYIFNSNSINLEVR